MTNIKHSSKSFDWHTPPDIIERARAVLGEIDFDPERLYSLLGTLTRVVEAP